MKVIFLIAALLGAFSLVSVEGERVVCYFASWTVYRPDNGKFDVSNIDPQLCTHILFGFVGLSWDNKIQILDGWESNDDGLQGFKHLIELKNQNPNLKILVSMGGWNEGSGKYSKLAADPEARATLIEDIVRFLKEHKFDGFDLDWEYPGQRDGSDPEVDPANFVTLLQEIKAAIKPEGYLLTIAVAGAGRSIDISYPDVKAVSDAVDIINVMSYDFHGAFEPYVGHHAPLYASHLDTNGNETLNVVAGIEHWLEKGADPSKLTLGTGTYGRSFTLADPNNSSLYAPAVGAGGHAGPYTRQEGILGYNEICELHSDWTYVWDDEQQVPHRVSGDQWVGYDDERSIALKVQAARDRNLGGIMVWSLDTDDFLGICGNGQYPLLKAINNALRR